MDFDINKYAKLEARLSPIYGWNLDTVKEHSNDELDSMHHYFFKKGIFVAVALNTFKEFLDEYIELEKRVTELEKHLPHHLPPPNRSPLDLDDPR